MKSPVVVLQKKKNPKNIAYALNLTCICLLIQDLDMVVRGLLAKNGESNGFIREDSERALAAMVDGVTPQRALLALIAGGAT